MVIRSEEELPCQDKGNVAKLLGGIQEGVGFISGSDVSSSGDDGSSVSVSHHPISESSKSNSDALIERDMDQAIGCEYQAKGCEDQAKGCEDQPKGCGDQARGYQDQVKGCEDQAKGCEDQAKGCEDQAKGCEDQVNKEEEKLSGWEGGGAKECLIKIAPRLDEALSFPLIRHSSTLIYKVEAEIVDDKFSKSRKILILLVLTFTSLSNYADRYCIAGVLTDVKNYYQIGNAEAGLLQTSFISSYMIFSPLFGFLGDRWSRKLLISIGMSFWVLVTMGSSFIPSSYFWAFLAMRGLVGVGEASYSTMAPSIIADLFVGGTRTKALAIFYFAIPVGSGLGYIVGSRIAQFMGEWQWALRITPLVGMICIFFIAITLQEPKRGASEGGAQILHTSWCADLSYLSKNKSFVFTSCGFTCVAHVVGALALWAPNVMENATKLREGVSSGLSSASTSLRFGIITCIAGLLGVAIGAESARRLRSVTFRAEPLVCAFGLIASSPFLFTALTLADTNEFGTWTCIFLSEVCLCLTWAVVTDILLAVVIPTRRATAEAVQILVSHAFGDAGSPYLVGVISESVSGCRRESCSPALNFRGLQYGLYMTCFVAVLGGASFLVTAVHIKNDKLRAQKIIREGTVGAIKADSSV